MQLPVQVTFRNMSASPSLEARIADEVDKLGSYYPHLIGCRVVVEQPHRHHRRGNLFHVTVDLTVPGAEIVVRQEPGPRATARARKGEEVGLPHRDPYTAVRDAFDAARRRLEDFARRQRGDTKHHELRQEGRVTKLLPADDCGFLEAEDGLEVYFHRNSVVDGFDRLFVGAPVAFVLGRGEKGPQASTVIIVGHPRWQPSEEGAIELVGEEREVEGRIARRAYQIWELSGRAPGRDVENWLRAEREVRAARR